MTTETSEVEYTMNEVEKHNQQDDCWVVIGNTKTGGPKVYNITKYLDNHPGGAEVLLDVAGKDADEFFEDIGHSKDARAELKKHLIGTLKLDEAEVARRNAEKDKVSTSNGGPFNKYLLVVAILVVIWAYYFKGK